MPDSLILLNLLTLSCLVVMIAVVLHRAGFRLLTAVCVFGGAMFATYEISLMFKS